MDLQSNPMILDIFQDVRLLQMVNNSAHALQMVSINTDKQKQMEI